MLNSQFTMKGHAPLGHIVHGRAENECESNFHMHRPAHAGRKKTFLDGIIDPVGKST